MATRYDASSQQPQRNTCIEASNRFNITIFGKFSPPPAFTLIRKTEERWGTQNSCTSAPATAASTWSGVACYRKIAINTFWVMVISFSLSVFFLSFGVLRWGRRTIKTVHHCLAEWSITADKWFRSGLAVMTGLIFFEFGSFIAVMSVF